MPNSDLRSRNFVRNAAGVWTPVGFGTTDATVPATIMNPNSSGTPVTVTAFGALSVTPDPNFAFNDSFEGTTFDTVNRWNTYGSLAATQSAGNLALSPGTTANATVTVTTQASLSIANPLAMAGMVRFESGTTALGNHRFWGLATTTGNVGTAAAPLTDAIGFEIDTAGVLRASVYSGGTRVFTQALTMPTDGLSHLFLLQMRGDFTKFYVDSNSVPVAQTYIGASSQLLPVRVHSLNTATVTGTPTFVCSAMSVLDVARMATGIADGAYPWRKATVNAAGGLATALTSATTGVAASISSAGTLANHLSTPGLASLGVYAGLSGYGAQRVTTEPSVLMSETFDGVLDTQRWTTGGTVAPTATGGATYIEAGTTASASSSLTSIPTFVPPGATFLGYGEMGRFENVAGATGAAGYLNSHRFFGLGLIPTTWTAAYTASATTGPLLHGYGFEIDTDGYMYAVIYANGVRTRADAIGQTTGEKRLNLGRSLFDGNLHQFTVVVRPDAVFWYIDGQDTPAALLNYRTSGYPIPDIQTLPLRLHTLNSTTAPTSAAIHRPAGIALGDTGHSNSTLSDATYPWRRAKVDPAGALAVGPRAADLAVSVTATSGTALTATLPAAGAGLYHYITGILITKAATVAVAGSATPVVVSSTNLPGTLAWTFDTAQAIGVNIYRDNDYFNPIKSSVANTATTIVAPASTSIIWRINVTYYTAP